MLLPSKHIKLSESIIGLSACLLKPLKHPKTIDQLVDYYERIRETKKSPAYHNTEEVFLAISFLFVTGIINLSEEGLLYIETT